MSDEKAVRDWNWVLGVGSWLIAAVVCSVFLAFAFDLSYFRTFIGLIGIRLGFNLIVIGGKDLYDGISGGGSRTL